MGGPVFVQDAEPGDLLEVEIETNRSRASGLRLLGAWDNPDQHRPALERIQPTINIIEHRPGPSGTARDGQAFLKGNYLWDLQPMIGCFGVAPEREVLTSSMGQSPAGGNLDIRDVKEGNGVGSYNFGSVSFNGSGDGAVGSGRRRPAVCRAADLKPIGTPRLAGLRHDLYGSAHRDSLPFSRRKTAPDRVCHCGINRDDAKRYVDLHRVARQSPDPPPRRSRGLSSEHPAFMGFLMGYLAAMALIVVVDLIWFNGRGRGMFMNGW